MTNLHDARVEAAMDEYLKIHLDEAGRPSFRESMRAALAAADAVVTVEMIAEVIGKSRTTSIRGDDGCKSVVMESNETIASAVLALIRGGGEQC